MIKRLVTVTEMSVFSNFSAVSERYSILILTRSLEKTRRTNEIMGIAIAIRKSTEVSLLLYENISTVLTTANNI